MFKNEHNAQIHLTAMGVVVLVGILLKINYTEWCFVAFAIGFVLSAEAFNTAIEALVDLVSPEYNKKAGLVKDVAAGGVLIAALTSVVIGCVVFGRKILLIMEL